MTATPQGQSPPNGEFESPREYILPLLKKITTKVKDVRKFLATRSAILNGEALYNETQSSLISRGLMGPWAFNATQSLLCSLPGMVVTALAWMIWGGSNESVPVQPIDPLQLSIASTLSPMIPPFALLITVYLTGLAFLPSGFNTLHNWKGAQRKCLYLDGTYGLLPQFVLASCVAVGKIPLPALMKHAAFVYFILAAAIVQYVAFFWQAYVTGWRIRSSMMEYDYIERPPMFSMLQEPSYFKMLVVAGIGIPTCILMLGLAVALSAKILASTIHLVRGPDYFCDGAIDSWPDVRLGGGWPSQAFG